MTEQRLSPEEIVERYNTMFGDGITGTRITGHAVGLEKREHYDIWIELDRDLLKPAIRTLMELHFPHLAVISGSDLGDVIRLQYHFSIYYGAPHGEYMVTLCILLPKSDLRVPTISDLIPGAVFSEREKQEFFGIEVTDIPDSRRLFLPEDFPEGVYPWRKDETGVPENMVKALFTVGRPTDRPAPPVPEKDAGVAKDEGDETAGKGKPDADTEMKSETGDSGEAVQ